MKFDPARPPQQLHPNVNNVTGDNDREHEPHYPNLLAYYREAQHKKEEAEGQHAH